MSTLSAELLRFVGELRLAEVPVSVAETLDAMRAVRFEPRWRPTPQRCPQDKPGTALGQRLKTPSI
jgi:hypothetical protein